MTCRRIDIICIVIAIACLPASGQPLLQSWKKVEGRLFERNSVASELNTFSLTNNLIAKEDADSVQHFIDSLTHSVKHCKQINKNYLSRIALLNRKVEHLISTYYSEESEASTSGNTIRLFALYKRAKEELYSSIEEHNRQAILIKRKDLVFHLRDK